jgi:pimeloyl-ACP methyl ester carboxylesterase
MPPSDHDRLRVGRLPRSARGVVLLLHGGAERGLREVDHRSLSYRRALWMSDSIAGPLARAQVGTAVLRFKVKGWNAGHADGPSPVADAREALARLRGLHPDLPIVLLGHSMGGRTAAWVADEPGVVGIVGVAPWWPADDPVRPLAGKHVVGIHGRRDRITSARATERFLERARAVAGSTRFVDMGPRGHYMLSGVRRWNAAAIRESLGILERHASTSPPGP